MNTRKQLNAITAIVALMATTIVGCKSSGDNGTSRFIPLQDGVSIELVQTPKGFWIGKTEVTQAQYKTVMGDNPSEFKGDDLPVESISWNDCIAFLEKLNALPAVKTSGLTFRIPTDEEWEFASRAGSTERFCKTEDGLEVKDETLPEVAWMRDNSEGRTHPVGQKKPNAFGLFDMIGNVDEWIAEDYEAIDPDAKGKDYARERVTRGGNYRDKSSFCSSGVHGRIAPDHRSNTIGIRLCAAGH